MSKITPSDGESEDRTDDPVQDAVLQTARLKDAASPQDDLDARRWRAAAQRALFGEDPDLPTVGRYSVVRLLGQGAHGVVYQAFDPDLERDVALKLVHMGTGGSSQRLLSEARSLARLKHPNVVVVHEVGHDGSGVFIAMELVDGSTLGEWMQEPRTLREILDVFAQAGRGLAAAHAAGLVHRDFKPANVLVGSDGRVRVSDFGLARSDLRVETDGGQGVVTSVAGTPAYMAPEQRRGHAPDHRADQYSYCVSLFEAFYGDRPVSADETASPPGRDGTRVPRWLRTLLRRGLAEDPDARHADMDAVLHALARGRATTRRRLWSVGLVAGTLAIASSWLPSNEVQASCRVERADGIWTDEIAAATRAAFDASGAPRAEHAWRRVDAEVSERVQTWKAHAQNVCAASEPELRAQGMCLQWQLHELQAFVALMQEADAGIVEHAVAAAASLPEPMRCASRGWSLDHADGNERAAIEQVHASIADARARLDTGRLEEALQRSVGSVREAQRLGARALEAEALIVRGRAAFLLQGSDAADRTDPETTLYAAWLAADAGDHPVASAEALVELSTWSVDQRRFEDATLWATRAEQALEPLQGVGRLRARLAWTRGTASAWQGRLDEAYEYLADAERLIADPDDPWMGRIHNTIGEVAFAHGDYARAEEGYRDLLELVTTQYGPDHLWVASANGNLGEVALARHRLQAAEEHFQHALRLREQILGADSYWVTHTHAHLADVYRLQGHVDRATDAYERVLRAPQHPSDPAACNRNVWAHHGLALIELEAGDLDAAWAHASQTLEASPKPDPAHLDLCDRFDVHARIWLARGQPQRALRHLQRIRASLEAIAGADHRNLVPLLTAEAAALRALDRELEAQATFRRAMTIHERDPINGPQALSW